MSKTLICWGGVGAVTGANFLLEIDNQKILIDCGLLQGVPGADQDNASTFPYDPQSIEMLFVTHAHIDHIGKIPKLVKDGFRGTIYSTAETKEIATLMLMDTAKISEENAKSSGALPLYDQSDVERSFIHWQTLPYHQMKAFGPFGLELFDAGHILGSAMYRFIFPTGKSILFTGDLGNSTTSLLRKTDTVSDLTYLLMDSVYGDRNHESPEERDKKFRDIVLETKREKKTLIIPTFSLERTQVILYELKKLFENGVESLPVYLDSPLAINVTKLYDKTKGLRGDFDFPSLIETARARASHEIELVPGPKIILAGSGMSTAGRILYHEERYLPDPHAVLLFVGYQAPGTLGREIQEGVKSVVIHNQHVAVSAKVVTIDGFSAHKDSDHLVQFVAASKTTLKKVFVTMGEPKSSIHLAQRLRNELGVSALVPERGEKYELDV